MLPFEQQTLLYNITLQEKKKVDTSKWIFGSAKRLTYLICFFLNNLVLILYDMNVSIWHYRRSN